MRKIALKKILISIAIFLGMVSVAFFALIFPLPYYPVISCSICHSQEVRAWAKSPHKKNNCTYCHTSSKESPLTTRAKFNAWVVSYAFNSYDRPVKAHVEDKACTSCHSKDIKKTITRNGITVSHKGILENGGHCTNCHNTVAHDKATTNPTYPSMGSCVVCHEKNGLSKDCDTCHSKTKGRFVAENGAWKITHGKNWKTLHGAGDLRTCTTCHSEDRCRKCHNSTLPHPDDWLLYHGNEAKSDRKACLDCHAEGFCNNCHQTKMPHPDNFLPSHPEEARRIGKDKCLNCHKTEDCDSCHTKHIHPSPATIKKVLGIDVMKR